MYDYFECIPPRKLEVKINNEWHLFDAQTDGPLEEAKIWHFAHGFTEYLGSTDRFYINGELQVWNKLHHFFKRHSK